MKILMVCLGNICRSPLAEGILQHKLRDKGLDWQVDSAGTSYWHIGENPDRRSVSIARYYGIDISQQRARQLQPRDLKDFDLVFAMDRSNYENILKLANSPEEKSKVKLIMDQVYPGANEDVPDPYWDDDGFEKVYQMLDKACEKVIEAYIR